MIEALLFASDTPLSPGRLVAITETSSTKDVRAAIASLSDFYSSHMRSFEIVEVAGGYQVTTLPEFSPIVVKLFKSRRKARLSKPSLETLAIVAYKQPISRMQIEAIRGVNCDGVLATLADRDLITITGRGDGVGRPYLYSTTRKFLEYLGLKDYRDLPSIEELEKNLGDLGDVGDTALQSHTAVTPKEETEADNPDVTAEHETGADGGSRPNGE